MPALPPLGAPSGAVAYIRISGPSPRKPKFTLINAHYCTYVAVTAGCTSQLIRAPRGGNFGAEVQVLQMRRRWVPQPKRTGDNMMDLYAQDQMQ